jgi:hypothetical protein
MKYCQPMFQKLTDPQVRDTLVTDILGLSTAAQDTEDGITDEFNLQSIPQDVRRALSTALDFTSPQHADFSSHLTIGGITYAVSSRHTGNSQVLVAFDENQAPVPARIHHILRLRNADAVKTLVAVRRYEQAQVTCDPFARYPVLRTKIWSTRLQELEIVSADAIHSHFAACPVTWEEVSVVVVTSLSRVSLFPTFKFKYSHLFTQVY